MEDYRSPDQDALDLSVVIVNWNVSDLLRRCLRSILAFATSDHRAGGVWRLDLGDGRCGRFEVLVVDSASADDSVAMARREFPAVRLHASPTNLGYSRGNNWGLSNTRGRYVLLLNPDTEVLPGALEAMLEHMEEEQQVGLLGPQMLWPDGSVQSSCRRFPTLLTALTESTFVEKWFPKHAEVRRYKMLDQVTKDPLDVDWLVGSCLMVRREVIEQVGLLDEGYFMYSEELDWQKRIKDAGWRIVYLPSARVVHYEGKSSEQVPALTHVRFGRSKVRYYRKHHSRVSGEIVRFWLLLNYLYEWGVEAAKWCVGHKRELRRQRMRAYYEVLRSGL
jgi:N-acetylglucosaminyl-diphospho-decaprenol L-rhamnosyltransferase